MKHNRDVAIGESRDSLDERCRASQTAIGRVKDPFRDQQAVDVMIEGQIHDLVEGDKRGIFHDSVEFGGDCSRALQLVIDEQPGRRQTTKRFHRALGLHPGE
jgi:hypothetical protein